jgi:serine/threonine protein kinase
LSPSEAQEVDRVCDAFEEAWKAGQHPRIEDFLSEKLEPVRAALVRQLLTVELEYRRRLGEQPKLEDYEMRFPSHQALLRETRSPHGMNPTRSSEPRHKNYPSIPGYEILDELGRGAMGVVYRACHRTREKQVALKVLLPGMSTDRFLREAKLLAKIDSAHVVAVHDFATLADGSSVLIMDWVEGADLARTMRTRGGSITEDEALPWMKQTCKGMLAAAEQGIIHRDFKPSNVLIDTKGRARVVDFGLARGPTSLGDLTLTKGIMGTPFYMAPEQAEDPRGVDTRADIYSLGATFYHVLTGRPPFRGQTAFSILYKHKTEPLISPRALRPELSERTSELLERCLAKMPADRFSSFSEVLAQLEASPGTSSPWSVSDDAELVGYLARYQSRRESYLNGRRAWNADLDIHTFPRGQVLRAFGKKEFHVVRNPRQISEHANRRKAS